jgi:hypothetical protein
MLACINGVVVSEKIRVSKSLSTQRKGFQMNSKRVKSRNIRMNVDAICLRSMRQLVFRRHELITGLDLERERPARVTSVNPPWPALC